MRRVKSIIYSWELRVVVNKGLRLSLVEAVDQEVKRTDLPVMNRLIHVGLVLDAWDYA